MIHIEPISAFSDNYIWCLYNDAGEAVVVDPGDAAPVEAFLADRSLKLTAVLITHHHFDHVGGLAELTRSRGIDVFGPRGSAPQISSEVSEGDCVRLLGLSFEVLAVPGHTLDHIAYFAASKVPPLLFCGDTLFAGGCGRLFEGTPEQMHHSLSRLKSLPPDTEVYCAHEYTLANLRFAQAVTLLRKHRQLLLATSSQRPVSQTTRAVIQELKRQVRGMIGTPAWAGAVRPGDVVPGETQAENATNLVRIGRAA